MKNILIGNGINIQHDNVNYTTRDIIIRLLKELDNSEFPKDFIVDEPIRLKYYLGKLFLFAREAVVGGFDSFANCTAERKALEDFKNRYCDRLKSLTIADMGFEDYYLIHDLVCHRTKTENPDMYILREALKMVYIHSIYNHGEINRINESFNDKFILYLKSFDKIFTTNYDQNLSLATNKHIHHIHGQFDKLSEVYNKESFKNQTNKDSLGEWPDNPNFNYLHSTAVSTYCGDYKQFQIKHPYFANQAIEKFTTGYQQNEVIQNDVNSWEEDTNPLLKSIAKAIKLKAEKPDLRFQEDYSIDDFQNMLGSLEILGLSPYNDYHLFDIIDNAKLNKCTYYYFEESECVRIKSLLPKLEEEMKLQFLPVREFWKELG